MSRHVRLALDMEGRVTIVNDGAHILRTLSEAVNYVRQNHEKLEPDELRCFGCICLVLSLREYGKGAPDVTTLSSAEKALDSFYLHTDDARANDHIDEGIRALQSHLFGIRYMQFEQLLQSAFRYCADRLEGSGQDRTNT